MPTKEEMLALMKSGTKSKEIVIPQTHEPTQPHRVLTQAEERLPKIKDEVISVPRRSKPSKVLDESDPVLQVLQNINTQLVRMNELLTQIRNSSIDRPFDWKSPEEVLNGEISEANS